MQHVHLNIPGSINKDAFLFARKFKGTQEGPYPHPV
jgi:hypothetical protein